MALPHKCFYLCIMGSQKCQNYYTIFIGCLQIREVRASWRHQGSTPRSSRRRWRSLSWSMEVCGPLPRSWGPSRSSTRFAVPGRSLRIFSDDNFTSIISPFLRSYNMEMKHFMCHCCTLAKMYISPLSIDWDLRDVSRCSGSRATDQYFWGTSRETPCITNIFHIQHIHVQTMQ